MSETEIAGASAHNGMILADLHRLRLSVEEMHLGADPDLTRRELVHYIRERAGNAPRSLQRTIGPSELGTPCTRRLGYQLTGAPRQERTPAWLPVVGTAVHEWLAETFVRIPLVANDSDDERPRYLVEHRVCVGEIDGVCVTGSCDLYDRVTASVIDWKIVGKTTLTAAKRHGPVDKYRTQVHLYGRGFLRRGLPVERVAIGYLPRNGDLSEAYLWSEHYDETVAAQALTSADAIVYAAKLAGAERIIPQLPTADDYCATCYWYVPGAEATAEHCPGHNRRDPAQGLIA